MGKFFSKSHELGPAGQAGDASGGIAARLKIQHVLPVLVAVALVLIAVREGGYQLEFVAAMSVLTWWTLAIGVGLRLLPRVPISRSGTLAALLLTAAVGFTALSIAWASDNGEAFNETVRWGAALGLFLLALLSSGRGEARLWLEGMALGLLIVAVISLASRYEPTLGNEGEISRVVGSTSGRLSFPLGYWNALGASMGLLAVLLAWFSATGRSRLLRALATASLCLPALTIFLASSRGAIVASVVGLLVLVTLSETRSAFVSRLLLGGIGGAVLVTVASGMDGVIQRAPLRDASGEGALLMLMTLVVIGAVGATAYLLDERIAGLRLPRPSRPLIAGIAAFALVAAMVALKPIEHFDDFKEPPPPPDVASDVGNLVAPRGLLTDSSSGRYQIWTTAVDAFGDEPLHGIGAGGFRTYFDTHGTIYYPVRDAHSLPLETLAELGAVGLLLLAGFFAAVALPPLARWRRGSRRPEEVVLLAVLATGLVAVAIDWTWDFLLVSSIILVAAALLVGVAAGPPSAEDTRPRPRLGLGVGVALILVAGMSLWTAGTAFLTERELNASRAGVEAGDLVTAESSARDAVDLEPWSAEARTQQALVAERLEDFPAALEAIKAANARSEEDSSLWFLRARLELRAGNVPEAKAAMRRARELNSNSVVFAIVG